MGKFVGIDLRGEMMNLDDIVQVKEGKGVGSTGPIKQHYGGFIFLETPNGMVKTECHLVLLMDRAPEVLVQ
jgi:hypothetical protein